MGTDIHAIGQIKKDGKWTTTAIDIAGCDRSYNVFAVLANVRNGSGFAGTDTGEEWEVLYPPRGLPKDVDIHMEYGEITIIDEYFIGDHGHSYLSLQELKSIWDHFKDREYEIHGMVKKEELSKLKQGILPQIWCYDTHDPNYVNAKWKVPCKEALWYLGEFIDVLDNLRSENELNDEEIRMVFGFDS
jgi:hypothetical protein